MTKNTKSTIQFKIFYFIIVKQKLAIQTNSKIARCSLQSSLSIADDITDLNNVSYLLKIRIFLANHSNFNLLNLHSMTKLMTDKENLIKLLAR